ncbi:Helper protein [Sulfitobacter guttiformis KCTC 32187]|nr:Helper protein [Sulfitobacter guttiformis KCTC 32187]
MSAAMAGCGTEVRSISYHMKAARFPAYKDLSGFNFSASEINEALCANCTGVSSLTPLRVSS